jgi:hypothetical protein
MLTLFKHAYSTRLKSSKHAKMSAINIIKQSFAEASSYNIAGLPIPTRARLKILKILSISQ